MQLGEEEHRDDVSDSSVATEDSYTYSWQATEFVRCRGSAWHPCANDTLIRRGYTKCNWCKQQKAKRTRESIVRVRLQHRVWQESDAYNERHNQPEPDSEDSDPEGNNVTFRVVGGNVMVAEGGDSFTRSQAVCAATDVARALAAHGECGLEELIEPGHETPVVRKTVSSLDGHYHSVVEQVLCRIAYVADPNVLAYNTVKAASMLGGVRVRPPVVQGKDRMPNIGQINECVYALVLEGMFDEIAYRLHMRTPRERNQLKALSKFDNDALAICCNAVLAAGCIAYIMKHEKLRKLDTEHLKWHMFLGGRSVFGEPPHLAVSMFMDCRTPKPDKESMYHPHPKGEV